MTAGSRGLSVICTQTGWFFVWKSRSPPFGLVSTPMSGAPEALAKVHDSAAWFEPCNWISMTTSGAAWLSHVCILASPDLGMACISGGRQRKASNAEEQNAPQLNRLRAGNAREGGQPGGNDFG